MSIRNGLCAALLAAVASAVVAPVAYGLGVKVWEAGTCVEKGCTYPSVEANPGEAFTQAAGHPPWGITSFEVNAPGGKPEEQVKRIRVDVPEGLAANPQALPSCSRAEFDSNPALCLAKGAKVGETEVKAALENPLGGATQETTNTGTVYNLTPEPGLPLLFGIAIEPTGGVLVSPIRLFLEGHVSWGFEPSLAARGIPSGDFHEWFQIDNVPREAEAEILGIKVAKAKLSTIKSKLFFEGQKGGHFLTLPSVCSSSTTSYLELEAYEGGHVSLPTHTPVGVTGCGGVPFAPTVQIKGEPSQYDSPDGAVTVLKVPQQEGAGEINTADIKDAHVTLPEGLTLNPAAANGLTACTQSQLGKGSSAPVACPASSKVGTVLIETALPTGSLTGDVYLGKQDNTGPITGPPYLVFIDAESVYGVSVRLEGTAVPNPATGRLDVSFANNPQLPFSELVLALKGGPRAPLANPLTCSGAATESLFTPYTGGAAAFNTSPFAATGCPSPLPFSLTQGTQTSSPAAGAYTNFTFNLARADGQQHLSQIRTVLPAGLVGVIPSVPLCGEPQAQTGSCSSASQIGTASVTVGAGSEPYPFSGPVFLTGPYAGAPYGLSIPILAAAGPFNLGVVVTRVAIGVDPHSGRVIATSSAPTIVGGVPLRLRTVSVAVNRANFLLNPTNCGPLSTESTLTSTLGATAPASSAFNVTNCGALAFKPSFKVATSTKTSKRNGAPLTVTVTQAAHQANIRSVFTQLPLQLPSRLTTLQKACTEATFAANPAGCDPASIVGTVTATTPVLPGSLTGPAYLVSHGGAAFPNLVLVLQDGLVRVILEGTTDIKKGITSSTFASIPDVPVSSFRLNLPTGPHSALAAYGNLCAKPLLMPTVITAQSGAQIKQSTRISVAGCGVRILRRKVRHHTLLLTVRTPGAGRVIATATRMRTVSRKLGKASTLTLKLRLGRSGISALHSHRRLKIRVRVRFIPKSRGESRSAASTSATIRR